MRHANGPFTSDVIWARSVDNKFLVPASCPINPPSANGSLGRFRVFYRALGPTIALVIVPGNQNAFTSMELLAQVVRVVTVSGRAPELHVERVQRKFAEVGDFS